MTKINVLKQILSKALFALFTIGLVACEPVASDDEATSTSTGVDKRILTADTVSSNSVSGGIEITAYKGTEKDIIIPATIGGKTVVSIGVRAFSGKGITRVKFAEGLETIGDYAFQDNLLTTVSIPNSVSEIGAFAFEKSTLATVIIGSGVTVIGGNAFSGSDVIESVTINAPTPPATSIGPVIFESISNASLYVPSGSEAVYDGNSYWNGFLNINPIS